MRIRQGLNELDVVGMGMIKKMWFGMGMGQRLRLG